MTEEDIIADVIARNQAQGYFAGAYWIIDDAALPGGVTSEQNDLDNFFDSWVHDGTKVVVDMSRARGEQMNRIRTLRAAKLAAADIAINKAQDAGDGVAEAAERAKRQALRDLPQTFDLSGYATPETLKDAWPQELL